MDLPEEAKRAPSAPVWNKSFPSPNLAELLVVITDQLKIVRICARNVPRVHRHKRIWRLSRLSLQESDCVVCWCVGVPYCWNINRLQTTCTCLAVVSDQENCRDSMPSSFRASTFNNVVYSDMGQVRTLGGKCVYSIHFQPFCHLLTKTY